MLKNDPLFDKDFNIIEPAQSGQIFKELVNRGADLNLVDEYGNTPLSTCIQSYQSSLFDFMVRIFLNVLNFDLQCLKPIIYGLNLAFPNMIA
jgi:ankyrin repeat protein